MFWLPFRPTLRAFPEASSSGIVADFVHGYSCGAAVASHHLSRGSSSFSDSKYYTLTITKSTTCMSSGFYRAGIVLWRSIYGIRDYAAILPS